MRLAGVIRVSHMGARRAGDTNVHADRDQVTTITEHAARIGGTIEILPPELDVSGGLPLEQRPSLLAAIEGVEQGRYDAIIVAYLSRLGRNVREQLRAWDRVEAAGGRIIVVQEGIDTSTPSGRLQRTMMLGIAEHEREVHAERFENLREWATAAGVWQRRQTPRGYIRDPDTRKLTPSADAQLVRDAFAKAGAGAPVVAVARHLGMSTQGTRSLLRNRVYLGELKVGKYVNPDAHPPLISRATFDAAQTPNPRPARSSRYTEPALLAKLARCCGCGHVMSRGTTTRPTYICNTIQSGERCPAPATITIARLDTHVEQVIRSYLADLEVDEQENTDELARLDATAENARAELAAFLAGVSAAGLRPEVFADGARQRQAAVDQAENALTAARRTHRALGAVTNAQMVWPTLTVTERNHLLRGLLDYVAVRRVGRGKLVPVGERAQIVAAGHGIELPKLGAGRRLGIVPIPFHSDGETPAGILRGKGPLEGPGA